MMNITTCEKSTLVGVALGAVTCYAGFVELRSPPLHAFHAALLAVLLLFSVGLILGNDSQIVSFFSAFAKMLPWNKGDV